MTTAQDGKGEVERLPEEHYKYDDGFLDDSELIEYIETEKVLRSKFKGFYLHKVSFGQLCAKV